MFRFLPLSLKTKSLKRPQGVNQNACVRAAEH